MDETFISYTYARENIGECLNIKTGLFTAPVKGFYSFSFTTVKMKAESYINKKKPTSWSSRMTIYLKKLIGKDEIIYAANFIDSNDRYDWYPLTLSAIVFLETQQQVGIYLKEGFLHNQNQGEETNRNTRPGFTSFSGFLLHGQ